MDVFYLLFVILNRVIRFGHVKTLFHSWSLIIWTFHTFWAHIWISYFESSLHGINIFWLTFTTWKDSGQRVFWPREILFFNNFLVSHSTFFIAMCFSLFFVHFPTFSNVVLGVAWRAYLHIIFLHTLLLIQLPPPFTGFFSLSIVVLVGSLHWMSFVIHRIHIPTHCSGFLIHFKWCYLYIMAVSHFWTVIRVPLIAIQLQCALVDVRLCFFLLFRKYRIFRSAICDLIFFHILAQCF